MSFSMKDLANERTAEFRKEPVHEDLLHQINDQLQSLEEKTYQQRHPEHPFFFVFGLPRSGTTVLSQVLASGIDCGYINNFVARFYKAPLLGIQLFRSVYGHRTDISFQSSYAQTDRVEDIHEFGYFWRYWLQLEEAKDFQFYERKVNKIEWMNLRHALLNIQSAFERPMVMKNIFGAMFAQQFIEHLPTSIFIHVERDLLDVCCSILEARKKFYHDIKKWWSTIPPEISQLRDLDAKAQIAGQVYYLDRLYKKQLKAIGPNGISVPLKDLADEPVKIIRQVAGHLQKEFQYELNITSRDLPSQLSFRTYTDRDDEKEAFQDLLQEFEERERSK